MKFLVDNQLPAALAVYLRKKGMDSEHVLDAGLGEATDAELCRYATANERIIISKDEDFLYLASGPKAEFQLLWVRLGNCRTAALARSLRTGLAEAGSIVGRRRARHRDPLGTDRWRREAGLRAEDLTARD